MLIFFSLFRFFFFFFNFFIFILFYFFQIFFKFIFFLFYIILLYIYLFFFFFIYFFKIINFVVNCINNLKKKNILKLNNYFFIFFFCYIFFNICFFKIFKLVKKTLYLWDVKKNFYIKKEEKQEESFYFFLENILDNLDENTLDDYDQDSNIEINEEDFGKNFLIKYNKIILDTDELELELVKDNTKRELRQDYFYPVFDNLFYQFNFKRQRVRKYFKSSVYKNIFDIIYEDFEIYDDFQGDEEGGTEFDLDFEEDYYDYSDNDDDVFNLYLEFDYEKTLNTLWEDDEEQFLLEDFSEHFVLDLNNDYLTFEVDKNLYNIINNRIEEKKIVIEKNPNYYFLDEFNLGTPVVFDQYFFQFYYQEDIFLKYYLNLESFLVTSFPFLTEKFDDDFEELIEDDALEDEESKKNMYNESLQDEQIVKDVYKFLHFDEDYSLNEVDAEIEEGDISYNFFDFRLTGEEINFFSKVGNKDYSFFNFDRSFLFKDQSEDLLFSYNFEIPNNDPDFIEYNKEIFSEDFNFDEEYIEDSTLELSFYNISTKFGNSFFSKNNFFLNKNLLSQKYINFLLDFDGYKVHKIFLLDHFFNLTSKFFFNFILNPLLFKAIKNLSLNYKSIFLNFFNNIFKKNYLRYKKFSNLFSNALKIKKFIFNYFFFYNWFFFNFDRSSFNNFNYFLFTLNNFFFLFYKKILFKFFSKTIWENFFLDLSNSNLKAHLTVENFSFNFFFFFFKWRFNYKKLDNYKNKILKGYKSIKNIILNLKNNKIKDVKKKKIEKFFFLKKKKKNLNFFFFNINEKKNKNLVNFLNKFLINFKVKYTLLNVENFKFNSDFMAEKIFSIFFLEKKNLIKKLYKNVKNFKYKGRLNKKIKVKRVNGNLFSLHLFSIFFIFLTIFNYYYLFLIFFIYIFFYFKKIYKNILVLVFSFFWVLFLDYLFIEKSSKKKKLEYDWVFDVSAKYKYNIFCNSNFKIKNIYYIYNSGNYNFWKMLNNNKYLNSDFFFFDFFFKKSDAFNFDSKFLMSRTGFSSFIFKDFNLFLLDNFFRFTANNNKLSEIFYIIFNNSFKNIFMKFEDLGLSFLNNKFNVSLLKGYSIYLDKEVFFLKRKLEKINSLFSFNQSQELQINNLVNNFFINGLKYEIPQSLKGSTEYIISSNKNKFLLTESKILNYFFLDNFYRYNKINLNQKKYLNNFNLDFFYLYVFDDFFFFFKIIFFKFFFFFNFFSFESLFTELKDKFFFNYNFFFFNEITTINFWYFLLKLTIIKEIIQYRKILNKDFKYFDSGYFLSTFEKEMDLNYNNYLIKVRILTEDLKNNQENFFFFNYLGEGDPKSFEDRIRFLNSWFLEETETYFYKNPNYDLGINIFNIFEIFSVNDAYILFEYLTSLKEFNEDYFYYYFSYKLDNLEISHFLEVDNLIEEGDFENFFFTFFFEIFDEDSFANFSIFFDFFFLNSVFFDFFKFNYNSIFNFLNFFFFFEFLNIYLFSNFFYNFFNFDINIVSNPIIELFIKLLLNLFLFFLYIIAYFIYFFFYSAYSYFSYFFDTEFLFGKFWENFGFINFFSNFYFNDFYFYFFFLDYILPIKMFFFNILLNLNFIKNNEVELLFRDFFYYQEYLISQKYLYSNLNDFKLNRSIPYDLKGFDSNYNYSLEMFNYGILGLDYNIFNFFF